MKLSTKVTYGVRAMLALALCSEQGPVSVKAISEKEKISISYLEQLLNKLKRGGLVKSIRGPKGGYILAKDAKDIKIGDIVRSLQGKITPVFCLDKNHNKGCGRIDICVTRLLWKKLGDNISQLLDSTTLGDLYCEAKQIESGHNIEHRYIFHI